MTAPSTGLPTGLPTILALDVSKSRIGFAVNAGRLAFGRGSVDRKRLPLDLKAVRLKVEETGAGVLLLGLPLRTDGAHSPAAATHCPSAPGSACFNCSSAAMRSCDRTPVRR